MLVGKGYYIWLVSRVESGNIPLIVDMAQSAQLAHILIKIADGTASFNTSTSTGDLARSLTVALQARGIEVWGWHFVYGNDPNGEAAKAAERVQQTGVTGYIIDAESDYKLPGKSTAATIFMQALRSALPFFPVALSSYRYPTLHPQLPWAEFLSRCDYAMPQVYWLGSSNPAEQLARCISEYRAITNLPIVPTGAAYSEGGFVATPTEVVQFLNACRAHNLSGANFWEWYTARRITNMWETIAGYDWPVTAPADPPLDIIGRGRVNANSLNVRAGPGTSYPILGALKLGTRVTMFNLLGNWAKISLDQERWVSADYLDRVP